MMELRGTGFNTLGQIQSCLPGEILEDLWHFTKLARGKSIEVLYTGWAQTVFLVDGDLNVLGLRCSDIKNLFGHDDQNQPSATSLPRDQSCKLVSAAGSESDGLLAIVLNLSPTPKLYIASSIIDTVSVSPGLKGIQKDRSNCAPFIEWTPTSRNNYVHIITVAIASSGVTAAVLSNHESGDISMTTQTDHCSKTVGRLTKVVQFNTFTEFLEHLQLLSQSSQDQAATIQREAVKEPSFRTFTIPGQAKCLLGNALSFVLLTEEGMVWTWACESRFAQALGRDSIGVASGATSPGIVEELAGLKIIHIAAGGWIAGAVSEGGEAWVWGCDAPGARNDEAATIPYSFFSHLKEINNDEQDSGNRLIKLRIPLTTETPAPGQQPDVPCREDEDVETGIEINDLAIGEAHLLVLDSKGLGWCCGSNAYGQLGINLPHIRNVPPPKQDEETILGEGFRKLDQLHNATWTPLNIHYEQHPVGWNVKRVFCGDASSFVLVEDSNL